MTRGNADTGKALVKVFLVAEGSIPQPGGEAGTSPFPRQARPRLCWDYRTGCDIARLPQHSASHPSLTGCENRLALSRNWTCRCRASGQGITYSTSR